MIDQLIIGSVASYDDYDANVKSRTIATPKKKIIKETVPFSNKTYDFSAINGELYWEERELEYIFEMTADSPEKLENKKQAFASWVMNVVDAEIHDPHIPDYHFKGTFEDMEFEDEEELDKTTIAVVFMAYPYMISNTKRVHMFDVPLGVEVKGRINNNSSHRITPTFTSDHKGGFAIAFIDSKGNYTTSYSFPMGETTTETIKIEPGVHSFIARSSGGDGTLQISFHEEVF